MNSIYFEMVSAGGYFFFQSSYSTLLNSSYWVLLYSNALPVVTTVRQEDNHPHTTMKAIVSGTSNCNGPNVAAAAKREVRSSMEGGEPLSTCYWNEIKEIDSFRNVLLWM